MSKLNWRRASLETKPSLTIADEKDYRGRDAAARWLERHDKPRKPVEPSRRPTEDAR